MNQPANAPRFAGLDGLRGWAVLAVVAFHSGLLGAGWVGVDLFMALSGFLITGVIVRELESDERLRLGRFWGRRARRLVPALVLVLGLVAVVSVIEPTGWTLPSPREVWGALTYTSNWSRLGMERSYWQMFDAPSAFDHLWSLAIEEQFYVVWPLAVYGAWKWRGRGAAMGVAIVGFLATATVQVVLARTGSTIERIYVGTDTRAPAFLAGATLCMVRARVVGWSASVRSVLALVSAAMLVIACFVLDGDSRFTYSGPLLVVSVAGALRVVVASSFGDESRLLWPLANRPLRMIGRWSYGVYLVHWPVILLLGIDRWSPTVRFVVATSISVALAALSHEFFERPVLDRGVSRRMAPVAVVAIVATATFALVVAEQPEPEMTAEDIAALATPLPAPPSTVPTAPDDAEPSADTTVPPVVRERVLVVGDSVVFGMKDALVDVGDSMRMDVAVRSAPGCTTSPLPDDQNNLFSVDMCASIRTGLHDDVVRFRPDRIIVFYGGTWDPFLWMGESFSPCSDDGRARIREGVDSLLADLGDSALVEIVVPPQMAGAYGPRAPGAAECYADVYLATAGVNFVRLDEYVCPVTADACADVVDGIRLRHDGLHFSPEGIAAVVPRILSEPDHGSGL